MSRNNCFDVIRLIAALTVLVSHHYALHGLAEPTFFGLESFGGAAVVVFFSISGYLVGSSGLRSDNFVEFMAKRCRRIFPALIPFSIFVFIIMGFIYGSRPHEYYISYDSFISLAKSITLQTTNTSDISKGFIYKHSVNGSMWTLPLEFACYLVVGLIISLGNNKRLYALCFVIFTALSFYTIKTGFSVTLFSVPVNHLATRGMVFFLGATMACSRDSWNTTSVKIFTIAIISIYMISSFGSALEYKIMGYIFICLASIYIGVSLNDNLIKGRFDYSYGIYIYAFPVQQICINSLGLGFLKSMAASLAFTIILASLSWHFVESYFLRKKKA